MRSRQTAAHHPFDPLTADEITVAVAVVKKEHGDCFFNVVSLREPRKADMLKWLAKPIDSLRPSRIADVVVINKAGKVFDGLVDLKTQKIISWEMIDGAQPIVSQSIRTYSMAFTNIS